MKEAVVEQVEVHGELQKWFVNVADRCGRAPREQRAGPIRILIVQRARANGMDVDRDSAARKLEIRLRKRAGYPLRVPPVIESAVAHRIAVRKNLGRVLEDARHPVLAQLIASLHEPGVADI